MLYANYIRNKMHHLVKNIFASGYPLKIISKFKKKAVNYTIHGKTEIGKNLIPYPYMYTTRTVNGVTYTDNGDGSVTVSGTATGYSDFFFKIMSIAPNTTFTFSKNQSDDAANVAFTLRQLDENRALIGTEISLVPTVATHTFTTAENARYIQIACKRYANAECKGTYKPMLELGDTATEYEPYTEYGVGDKTKNLIPYPYANTTKTVNGVTFTDNGDGSITVNGTATAEAAFVFSTKIPLKKGTYYLSGCASGGSTTTWYIQPYIDGQYQTVDMGNGANYHWTPTNGITKIVLYVKPGVVLNGLVFKPCLINLDDADNILPYPYANTTKTINGVTFTDNSDGSITVNGTATANTTFYVKTTDNNFKPSSTTLYISGCPAGGSLSTYSMVVNAFKQTESGYAYITAASDTGNGTVLDLTNKDYSQLEIAINVISGTTVNNLVFKPKLISLDYEPYGYKIPLVNTGKNLIPYPYSGFGGEKTKIINGITFTDNGGGLITLNGAATADVKFNFTGDFALPPGNFQISINHDYQDFYLGLDEREGNPDKNGNYIVYCDLIVSKGVTINNGTCKPQIELGNTATEYEPYRAPDTTNVYHTAPLKDGESISYKADGLPELQLYKGENNITADTAVAPSAIDIKYLN